MKVSFEGKVRKVSSWPETMTDLRKVVSRKFTERSLIEDFDESQLKMSELSANQSSLQSFLTSSKKRKALIDWHTTSLFYEDSEGDLNVISEEEDLADAHTYALMKAPNMLRCSIVDKVLFRQIREEQDASILNESETWLKKDVYRKENKKEKVLPKSVQK